MKQFALLLCLATASLAESFPSYWMLGQPDAAVLIGLDVRSIAESPLGQSLRSQIQAQMQQLGPVMLQIPNAGLLSDIDHVFLSSPGEKKLPGQAPAGATQASPRASQTSPRAIPPAASPRKNPPFLIVAEGTFPASHLSSWTDGTHSVYRSVNVYGPPAAKSGTNNFSLAVLDEHTLILGDEKSVHGALDRRGTAAGPPKALLLRAAALAPHSDFWIVMASPSSTLPEAGGPLAGMVAEITGVDLGLSLRSGLALDANLNTKTEPGAQTMAQFLEAQMQVAAATQSGNPEALDLMRKLQVTAEGNQMRLHVELTQDEMDRQIRMMQTDRQSARGTPAVGLTHGPAAAPSGAVTPPKEPSNPSAPRTIKIFGLDDGVREIPLDGPKK